MQTKYKEGYTQKEIGELLLKHPNINIEKFNDALMGCTGMIVDGEFLTYHHDVELALRCGLENRNLKSWEWD